MVTKVRLVGPREEVDAITAVLAPGATAQAYPARYGGPGDVRVYLDLGSRDVDALRAAGKAPTDEAQPAMTKDRPGDPSTHAPGHPAVAEILAGHGADEGVNACSCGAWEHWDAPLDVRRRSFAEHQATALAPFLTTFRATVLQAAADSVDAEAAWQDRQLAFPGPQIDAKVLARRVRQVAASLRTA